MTLVKAFGHEVGTPVACREISSLLLCRGGIVHKQLWVTEKLSGDHQLRKANTREFYLLDTRHFALSVLALLQSPALGVGAVT